MTSLQRLLGKVAAEQDVMLATSHRRALVRRRLSSSPSQKTRRMASPWTALVLAGCCAVVTAVVAFSWVHRQPPRLTAMAGDTRVLVSSGSWLDAPEGAPLPLVFSDGTQVTIAPRSRMRILEIADRGARLALESGQTGVEVAHGDNRRWELRAGPFIVRVTGTRFEVSWRPNEDEFDLVLHEGQVELAGCVFGEGRRLVAGQKVHASCRSGKLEVAYDVAPAAARPPQPAEAAAIVESASPSSAAPTSAAGTQASAESGAESPRDGERSASRSELTASDTKPMASDVHAPRTAAEGSDGDWRALARDGRYGEALRAVERSGFGVECARAAAADLAVLGDMARRAGDPARARQAYTVLRERFAGSSQAAVAAFSLGVLEFDRFGAHAKAATWFRTYLRENPEGPLVREARGRLMEALQRAGSAEARTLAKDYLRDYPSGPHAELAQRLVSSE